MDYGRMSDPENMTPVFPVIGRALLAALVFGLLGHLSWELGDRIATQIGEPSAATQTRPAPSDVRGNSVRRLAQARDALRQDPLAGERALVDIIRQCQDPEVQQAASHALVAHAVTQWPHDQRGAFMGKVASAAILSGQTHRIPPSITIAQAILESGWGQSRLARNHHNLFGIKATTAQAAVILPTLEYTPAGVRVEPARFRVFARTSRSSARRRASRSGSSK